MTSTTDALTASDNTDPPRHRTRRRHTRIRLPRPEPGLTRPRTPRHVERRHARPSARRAPPPTARRRSVPALRVLQPPTVRLRSVPARPARRRR